MQSTYFYVIEEEEESEIIKLRGHYAQGKLRTLLLVALLFVNTVWVFSLIPTGKAGIPPPTLTPGRALSFDGADDYVSVPAIDANVYSFELWFNATTNNALIGSYRFLIQTADQSLTVWHDVYVGPTSWYPVSIGTNAWHHLVVIIDYASWQITPYLDGVSLGTKPTTTTTKPSISWMTIGSYGNSRFFAGLIDEVRVYDRALSAAEVLGHYNSGIGQYGRPETGLQGLWHFDGDATDYSGYGNNGTVYGAAYVDGHVPLPDVAITDVTATPEKLLSGETVTVTIKAKNVGVGAYENFTVTPYYDAIAIGKQSVTLLGIGDETTLTFSWSTVGVLLGMYTIKGVAGIVQGETNTTNNEMIDGTVWIVKAPVAGFAYSPVPAIENLSTVFDASASTPEGGTILWYYWNFGDTHTQNVTTPTLTHVYSHMGSYNVTLTVGDSEGLTDSTWHIVEVLRHDVVVLDVTPWPIWVYEGWLVNTNVTITNRGNFTETVTLDLYYNITEGSKVGTQSGISIDSGEIKTLTFMWNTAGVKPCLNYTMTAVAGIAFDSDTTNNALAASQQVRVRLYADINDDSKVDIIDVATAAKAFGSFKTGPGWNPFADVNSDGTIDIRDLVLIAKNFGKIA